MLKRKLLPLILLLSCLTARAYDFADTLPSGQVLYYNYVSGGVEVVHPNDNVAWGWNGYVKPTGVLTVPATVWQGGTTYAVVSVGDYAFRSCTGLTEVSLADGIMTVGMSAFYGCSGVTTLTLPATVTTVGDGAFSLMTALADVWMSASTPPAISSTAFYSDDLGNCTLHIPCGASAAYAVSPWSGFGTLVEGVCAVDITAAVNDTSRGSATGTGSYASGTVVMLTALPREGYSFICWNDGDTLNPRLIVATEDEVYTAMFFAVGTTVYVYDTVHDTILPTFYTLNVLSDNMQLGVGVGSAVLPAGTQVEICGLPLEGSRFVAWNDGVTDNPRQVTVVGALTFRALFAQTGIASADKADWTVRAGRHSLTVCCRAGERVRLYDLQGRCHVTLTAVDTHTTLVPPTAGVWLVQVGDGAARRIVID